MNKYRINLYKETTLVLNDDIQKSLGVELLDRKLFIKERVERVMYSEDRELVRSIARAYEAEGYMVLLYVQEDLYEKCTF